MPNQRPTPVVKPRRIDLRVGDRYFRVGNRAAFILGRNPAGMNPTEYVDHFRNAALAGERLMRIHFTYLPSTEKPGFIDDGMLASWDAILGSAEKYCLAVLPVLGVWSDWNDGSKNESWHTWHQNPYNIALGGPATKPEELFRDTACRQLWFQRLDSFVKHWCHRQCIVGWELFSELDLVTGATEDKAVEFVMKAASIVRAADKLKRPVTASQAGINEWPRLQSCKGLDLIQVHPYANQNLFGGKLDELIIKTVHERLERYRKPVLIGECGLDSSTPHGTLDAAPRAEVGIRHAIWASVVSGAMNGRMLWWQDGYDQFEKVDLCRHFQRISAPVISFVQNVDFTGFLPVACRQSGNLIGAVIGNHDVRLGWFSDVTCIPPEWPEKLIVGQTVVIEASAKNWQIEFIDALNGTLISKTRFAVADRYLTVPLPPFRGSVAFRMKRQP